jgi:sugar phosphate isomerase/epimerase
LIYLTQFGNWDEVKRLTASYGLGFESYVFTMGRMLDNLPLSASHFMHEFRPLYGNGLSFHGPFIDLNPGAYEPMVRSVTKTRFEQCYAAARMAKASKIVFHSGYNLCLYHVESWEANTIDFWKEFMSDKDESIQICLENLQDPDPESIVRVVDAVDHPAFFACFDVGHANIWSKVPVEAWITYLGNRIRHLHLNNNDGKHDLHSALDTGTLDIVPLLEKVLQTAPGADWVLEMRNAQAVESSMELINKL